MKTLIEIERELSPNVVTRTELYRMYQSGKRVQFEIEDGQVMTVLTFEEAFAHFGTYNARLGETVFYPLLVSA